MNFERYCGMACAAAILLIVTLNAWLGIAGPIWKAAWEMTAGDAVSIIVSAIGWGLTLAVGVPAFRVAQRQIKLGRDQIGLQQTQIDMQQQQISDAREQLRRAEHARLTRELDDFSGGIDRLMAAQSYLSKLTVTFPRDGRLDGWSKHLVFVHRSANDALSNSAVNAPFGYGERIATVVNRIQRLGERLTETSPGTMPTQGVLNSYEGFIKEAIEGVRLLGSQIGAEIPVRQAQMVALANERDLFAPPAPR